MSRVNDFVITVATANGSGSQSSNNVLVRSLFRMGIPVGGKNLFPSNIAGLPTWFTIRANNAGFTARKRFADIVVAMNPATAAEDLKLVHQGGFVFINSEIKVPESQLRSDIHLVKIPFRDIVQPVSDSVKLRKLLANMVYVGLLAELLEMPDETLEEVIQHQFGDKKSVIEANRKTIQAGRLYARENLKGLDFPHTAQANPGHNESKILIDGNTAAAMGLVFGGCTFGAWYPITPSSSLMENFIELSDKYRVDEHGKKNVAIVQAEDELASISMVIGAGWAGARAMTATSGPGLSLMSEAAGLAYYAEIPSVIWDVQRVGPSTGLPTRTAQGDVLKAYYLSHGDTKHVVLLPGIAEECFTFAQTALDLAEHLQTLVIVLSDLDTGMNLHIAHRFNYPTERFDRGKVLDASQLAKVGSFERYKDVDGDGIPYRTLTGTKHPLAAYFTRGTGHDEASRYSEDPEVFKANMVRLCKKFETAKTMVPKPVTDTKPGVRIGLVTYGSSHEATAEARYLLQQQGIETNCMRLRSLPFCSEVEEFLDRHERIYLIEQNRDAQMMSLLRAELPRYYERCKSVLHCNGLPMDADSVFEVVMKHERS
jgi:2-oxoglutarate/2-oxoacid ferredoxin oxidoreductase subunit alpha